MSWKPPPPGSPVWLQIPAYNLTRATKFYVDVLGFTIRPMEKQVDDDVATQRHFSFPGSGLEDHLGGGIVKIQGSSDDYDPLKIDDAAAAAAKNAGQGGIGVEAARAKMAPVYYIVDDLEETFVRVEKAGGRMVAGRVALPGQGFSAEFMDTEGNVGGLYSMAAKKGDT